MSFLKKIEKITASQDRQFVYKNEACNWALKNISMLQGDDGWLVKKTESGWTVEKKEWKLAQPEIEDRGITHTGEESFWVGTDGKLLGSKHTYPVNTGDTA